MIRPLQNEPEIQIARRAFPITQEEFAGGSSRTASASATIGWYGSSTFSEVGAIGIVRADGDFADLIGEIVRVHYVAPNTDREVYVYVAGSAAGVEEDVDLSLSRRAFLAIAGLWEETLTAAVEVVA